MKVIQSIEQLKKCLNQAKQEKQTVGFVPTMGFLHEGHLALVKQARKENELVVMSIFVNPAQFGPGEDYETYPRDAQKDFRLASGAGVDIIFMPDVEEMYPRPSTIQLLPGSQANALCGNTRPGHFDGVLKVILKLFNIVDPDHSYFGMKDAQQLAIIETFVEDFNFKTTIERVPTVREADGLAKSSRNVHLTEKERKVAPAIYQALKIGQKAFESGETVAEIEQKVQCFLEEQRAGEIDYISLLAYPSLEKWTGRSEEAILACAVKFGKARLIDNMILKTRG